MARNNVFTSAMGSVGSAIGAGSRGVLRYLRTAYNDGVYFYADQTGASNPKRVRAADTLSTSKSWLERAIAAPTIDAVEIVTNLPLNALHKAADVRDGYRRLRVDVRDGRRHTFASTRPMLMVITEQSMVHKHNDRTSFVSRFHINQRTRIVTRAYQREHGHILLNDNADQELALSHIRAMGAGSMRNVHISSNYGACIRHYDDQGKLIDSDKQDHKLTKEQTLALREALGQDVQGEDSMLMLTAHDGDGQCIVSATPNASDTIQLMKFKHNSRQRSPRFESRNEREFEMNANNGSFYNIVVEPQTLSQTPRLDNMLTLYKIAQSFATQREVKRQELERNTALTPDDIKAQLEQFDADHHFDLEVQFGRDGALVFTPKGVSKRQATKDIQSYLHVADQDVGMRITSVADVIESFNLTKVFDMVHDLQTAYAADTSIDRSVVSLEEYTTQYMLASLYQPDPVVFQQSLANDFDERGRPDSELAEISQLRYQYLDQLRRSKEVSDAMVGQAMSSLINSRLMTLAMQDTDQELEQLKAYLEAHGNAQQTRAYQDKLNQYKAKSIYRDYAQRHMMETFRQFFDIPASVGITRPLHRDTIVDQVMEMQDRYDNTLATSPNVDLQAMHDKRQEFFNTLQTYLNSDVPNRNDILNAIVSSAATVADGSQSQMDAWDALLQTMNANTLAHQQAQQDLVHQQQLLAIDKISEMTVTEAVNALQNNVAMLLPTIRQNYEDGTPSTVNDLEMLDANMKKVEELYDIFMQSNDLNNVQKLLLSKQITTWRNSHQIIQTSRYDKGLDALKFQEKYAETSFSVLDDIVSTQGADPLAILDYIETEVARIIPNHLPEIMPTNVADVPGVPTRKEWTNRIQAMSDLYNAVIKDNVSSRGFSCMDMHYRQAMAKYLDKRLEIIKTNTIADAQPSKSAEYAAELKKYLDATQEALKTRNEYDNADANEKAILLTQYMNDLGSRLDNLPANSPNRKAMIADYRNYIVEFQRIKNEYYINNAVTPEEMTRDHSYTEMINAHIAVHTMDEYVPSNDPASTYGIQEISAERANRAQRYLDAQRNFTKEKIESISSQQPNNTNNIFIILQNANSPTSFDFASIDSLPIELQEKIQQAKELKEEQNSQDDSDEYNLPNGRKLVQLPISDKDKAVIKQELSKIAEFDKELTRLGFAYFAKDADRISIKNEEEEKLKQIVRAFNNIKSFVDKSIAKEYRDSNMAKYTLNALMELHGNIGGTIRRKEKPHTQTWEEFKNSKIEERRKLQDYITEALDRGVEVDRNGAIYIKDQMIAGERDYQKDMKARMSDKVAKKVKPNEFIIDVCEQKIDEAKRVLDGESKRNYSKSRQDIHKKIAENQEKIYTQILDRISHGDDISWSLDEDRKAVVVTFEPKDDDTKRTTYKKYFYEHELKEFDVDIAEFSRTVIQLEKSKLEKAQADEAAKEEEAQNKEKADKEAKEKAILAEKEEKEKLAQLQKDADAAKKAKEEAEKQRKAEAAQRAKEEKKRQEELRKAEKEQETNKLKENIATLNEGIDKSIEDLKNTKDADKRSQITNNLQILKDLKKDMEKELKEIQEYILSEEKIENAETTHNSMQDMLTNSHKENPPTTKTWYEMAEEQYNNAGYGEDNENDESLKQLLSEGKWTSDGKVGPLGDTLTPVQEESKKNKSTNTNAAGRK
ncbi:MAG: hypothetical protein IKC79_02570 [Clostridia bacterium]|nr:hypothetical protein [Clostridia bacterium]